MKPWQIAAIVAGVGVVGAAIVVTIQAQSETRSAPPSPVTLPDSVTPAGTSVTRLPTSTAAKPPKPVTSTSQYSHVQDYSVRAPTPTAPVVAGTSGGGSWIDSITGFFATAPATTWVKQ